MTPVIGIQGREAQQYVEIGPHYTLEKRFIKGTQTQLRFVFAQRSGAINFTGHVLEARIEREFVAGERETANLLVNSPMGTEPFNSFLLIAQANAIADLSPGTYHLQVVDRTDPAAPEAILSADLVISEGLN